MSDDDRRQLAVVLFGGFALFGVFGPLQLFGALPDRFAITLVGRAPSKKIGLAQWHCVQAMRCYSRS